MINSIFGKLLEKRYAIWKLFDEYPLLSLIIIAIIPRLIILFYVSISSQLFPFGGLDHDGYCEIAENLVKNGIYSIDGVSPTFGRAPLYPFLLAPGAFFGVTYHWGRILNLILGVTACVFLFRSGILFGVSKKIAFMFALFLALNPWFAWFTKNGMTYVLTTFLLSFIYLLIATIYAGNRRLYIFILLGLVSGLTALSHPAYLPLIFGVAMAIIAILVGKSITVKRTVYRLMVMIFAFITIILPWTLRNYYHTKEFFPIVSGFGYQYLRSALRIELLLKKGKFPWEKEGDITETLGLPIDPSNIKFFVISSDRLNKELDGMAKKHILTNIKDSPIYFAKSIMVNILFLWFGDSNWWLVLMHLTYILFLILTTIIGITLNHKFFDVFVIIVVIAPIMLLHGIMHAYIQHAAYSIPLTLSLILSAMISCADQSKDFSNY